MRALIGQKPKFYQSKNLYFKVNKEVCMLESSQMPDVFYHSLIYGLGFFISILFRYAQPNRNCF